MSWTLDDIDWTRFDPAKVDDDLLQIVKAAALVEHNGGDYATYLCNIFRDDPGFQRAARDWAVEEIRHGKALARWAALADPDFDFDAAFRRFTEGYSLPLDAEESVRGTRAGELVARCIVETGTSSYYTSIADAADEPVLKQICRNIAADEFRHYKLFYSYLKTYLDKDGIGRLKRLGVALGRIGESEDDELAYAFYAANAPADVPYDHRTYNRAYARRAFRYYELPHVERVVAMAFKAAGLKGYDGIRRFVARLGYGFLSWRTRRLVRAGA